MSKLQTTSNTRVPVHMTLHNSHTPSQDTAANPILGEHHHLQRRFWEAPDESQLKLANENKPRDQPARSFIRQSRSPCISASTFDIFPNPHFRERKTARITQIKFLWSRRWSDQTTLKKQLHAAQSTPGSLSKTLE